MKILPLIAALLSTASPVAAQTSQVQQPLGAGGQTNNSPLTDTGVICLQEMVATFCNQPTSPNHAGYGSITASSGPSATAGTSVGSGVGVASGSAVSSTSISPCGAFPPPNELCN